MKIKLGYALLFLFIIGIGYYAFNRDSNQKFENFKITLQVIPFNEKEIQIFYKLNSDDRYSEDYSYTKFVDASNNEKEIVFEFDKGIKPKNIRIDFTKTPNDSIGFNSIKFEYNELSFEGNLKDFSSWFTGEHFYLSKSKPNIIYFKPDTIQSPYDPVFNGNQSLNSKLIKLFPPNKYDF